MLKQMGLALAALLVAAGGAAAYPSVDIGVGPAEPALSVEVRNLAEATTKYENNDVSGARTLLKAVVTAPTFADLSEEQRYAAQSMYGWTLVNDGEYAEALVQMKGATAFGKATGDDWSLRFQAAFSSRDNADALLSLTTLVQRWPAAVSRFDVRAIFQLVDQTRTAKDLADARFGLLDALNTAHWAPQDSFVSADSLWVELTLSLLERGQVREAQSVAENIVTPSIIADMRIDRRYDPITTADPDRYDIGKAADRRLAFLRGEVAAKPDRLEAINMLGESLLQMGLASEALALADDAIGRTRPADGGKSPFTDGAEVNWTYDLRSRALVMLGRGEEALATLKAGARRPERGHLNVSQALNLAELEEHLGHPADALSAIEDVEPDHVSAYGRMDRAGVLVQIYAQLKDPAKLRVPLDYMKAHAEDSPSWLIDALLEAGDMDEAARMTISMLDDPTQRTLALGVLQDTRFPPAAPDFFKRHHLKVVALRERADVKAAVDKVGRIEDIPLFLIGI